MCSRSRTAVCGCLHPSPLPEPFLLPALAGASTRSMATRST
jgi:hypothetical protein